MPASVRSEAPQVTIRLFAAARDAARTTGGEVAAATVGDALDEAVNRWGAELAEILPICRIWVDGEPADADTRLVTGAEVAVLPPVTGG
jgi:molybdopterin converting factor small subunit